MSILRFPIFANNGDTIALRDLYTGSSFSFDTEFTAPAWLTLNASNELVIAQNAVSVETPILIKLNLGRCFYLVVSPKTTPRVREDATELAMRANSTFDLSLIVENADTITFQAGQTQPFGSSIENSVFKVTTTGGIAYFTATNDAGRKNFEIRIHIVQARTEREGPRASRRKQKVENCGDRCDRRPYRDSRDFRDARYGNAQCLSCEQCHCGFEEHKWQIQLRDCWQFLGDTRTQAQRLPRTGQYLQ